MFENRARLVNLRSASVRLDPILVVHLVRLQIDADHTPGPFFKTVVIFSKSLLSIAGFVPWAHKTLAFSSSKVQI
jgi:hypothetical protein